MPSFCCPPSWPWTPPWHHYCFGESVCVSAIFFTSAGNFISGITSYWLMVDSTWMHSYAPFDFGVQELHINQSKGMKLENSIMHWIIEWSMRLSLSHAGGDFDVKSRQSSFVARVERYRGIDTTVNWQFSKFRWSFLFACQIHISAKRIWRDATQPISMVVQLQRSQLST